MLCFRCGSYNAENAPKCSVCGQDFVDEAGNVVPSPGRRVEARAAVTTLFAPGDVVAMRYRVLELIGQGGVGAVFRVRDSAQQIDLALKVIQPNLLQTEDEQRLFARQLKAARKLVHENIVRVFDEGHEGNRRFFTMKLLEGLTLRKIIRLRHEKSQAFTPEELVPIFHQLGAALDHAHKTTWHGDLKPENIIVLPDLLKITDFYLLRALPMKPFLGIAKARNKGFSYIAPEIRLEAASIDGRADIYSLGVILGEMLTGMVYEGHFSRAFTAALGHLPPRLDALIRRSLNEHPDSRFLRASDFARELDAALTALGDAVLPVPGARLAGGSSAVSAVAAASPGVHGPPPLYAPPPLPLGTDPARPLVAALHNEDRTEAFRAPPQGAPNTEQAPVRQLPLSDEPMEIGQSQVMLIEASGSGSFIVRDELASSTRRESGGGPRGGGEIPTRYEGIPREPLRAEDLIETPYHDENADALIPPPLPDGPHLEGDDEHDDDTRIPLPGDESDNDRTLDLASAGLMPFDAPTDDGPVSLSADALSSEARFHEEETALPPRGPAPAMRPLDLRREAPTRVEGPVNVASDEMPTVALIGGAGLAGPPNPPATSPPRTVPPPPPTSDDSTSGISASKHVVAEADASSVSVSSSSARGVTTSPASRSITPPVRTKRRDRSSTLLAGGLAFIVLAAVGGWLLLSRSEPAHPATSTKAHPSPQGPAQPANEQHDGKLADVVKPEAKADVAKSDVKVSDPKGALKPNEDKPADAKPTVGKPDGKPSDGKPADPQQGEGGDERATVIAAGAGDKTCPRGMAFIDAGAFQVGSAPSDPLRNFGERNIESVETPAYCIDYYEQPNDKAAVPTTGVSWMVATETCERKGKRLCSEVEWERACKGPSGLRFPYGNTYSVAACNTEDEAGNPRAPQPATAFRDCKSAFRVYALAGNVEEWTADAFGESGKTVKGGAANRPDFASRCAARRGLPPRTVDPFLGYRCCASTH